MHYARTIAVGLAYEEAVSRVKEAFQAQGFGTLTEVDVRATPKEKLDEETEPYAILGFCNPDWPTVRLPSNRRSGFCCPATLSSAGMTSRPWFMLSMQGVMVRITERSELGPIAEEAARRIDKAMNSLSGISSRAGD